MQPEEGKAARSSRQSACNRCRRTKRKCDGSRPVCGECTKVGRPYECAYKNAAGPSQPHRTAVTRPYSVVKWHLAKSKANVIAPEIVVMDVGDEWWKLEDIPTPLSDLLMLIFLNHTPQVHFDELAPSIISRMSRFPPSHPSYPHPSLLNAMYLIASYYLSSPSHPAHIDRRVKWNPAEVGQRFLTKSRKHMLAETPKSEYLVDFVLSMGLMTRYFFWTMRLGEGFQQGLDAMKLAKACNLHRISAPNVTDYPASVLPPPSGSGEVRVRMNAFWNTFIMDRARRIVSEGDVSVPDDMITTTFPRTVQHFSVDGPRSGSIVSLISANSTSIDASNDSAHIMKVKMTTFLAIIGRIVVKIKQQGATSLSHASIALYTEFCTVEDAFMCFISSIPGAPPPVSSFANLTTSESAVADHATLRTMCQGGIIRLNEPFISQDESSRMKVLAASKEIMRIAREVARTNEVYWQIPIHFSWIDACDAFQHEVKRILDSAGIGPDDEWRIFDLRNDIEYIASLMKRFIKVYPFNKGAMALIDGLLRKDADAVERLCRRGDLPPSSNAQVSLRDVQPEEIRT